MNFFYRDSALLGLDETTLALYRWNDALSQWQLVPSAVAISSDVLSASLTELGTFALFADASDDIAPPGAINDLRATPGTNGWNVRLDWTAPGDDGSQGTAATYVLRFSTAEITASNVEQAVIVPIAQAPHVAGTAESFEIVMPAPGVNYFFTLQALDKAGNLGPLSTATAARSYQEDTDGDGMPDQWEATYQLNSSDPSDANRDEDGDGLTNLQEFQLGTNPRCWDTDGDGMSDLWEREHGLDPRSAADRDSDADGDGLLNCQEYNAGTDPNLSDTDGDGLPDGWEVTNGLCAFSASGDQGASGDPDQDGMSNLDEYRQGGNPLVSDRLQFGPCQMHPESGFEMTVLGPPGRNYTIEFSDDLVTWQTWTNCTSTSTTTRFFDPTAANTTSRFYRVATP